MHQGKPSLLAKLGSGNRVAGGSISRGTVGISDRNFEYNSSRSVGGGEFSGFDAGSHKVPSGGKG